MLAGGFLKTICCVLKSGGDFVPEHVAWLRTQCAEHMPGWHFQCWSDMDVPDAIALTNDWPKWWAKFEIYGTEFDDPALVIDLDTVFLGELKIRPEHEGRAIFLRDFWRDGFRKPERLAGGFTYLPHAERRYLYRKFIACGPEEVMRRWDGDDQPFYHDCLSKEALRWQDHYVDEVVSYKAHVRWLGIQPENKAICFHGTPRPWHSTENWVPSLKHAQQPVQELV